MKNRALVLTYSGYQDQEVVFPYYRLLGEKFQVKIVGDKRDELGRIFGIMGVNMPCHLTYSDFLSNINLYQEDFDLLILPGGVKALEKLRQIQEVLQFIAEWHKRGKVISSTCHGAQLLISAGIVKGRNITGYPSLKDDIVNAGAFYINQDVVIDENIVSSPHYDHMGEWMEKTIEIYKLN